jgi:TonB family protein
LKEDIMKDHKQEYGVYLRVGIVSSLSIFVLLFLFVPYSEPEPYELKRDIVTILQEIYPELDHREDPLTNDRPEVVIEAQDDCTDDVVATVGSTTFDEPIITVVPMTPEVDIVPYYKVEVKPMPVEIPTPEYPPLLRRAGIEGTTVIKALVGIDGSINDVEILKTSGNSILDQEAFKAAKGAQFTPAKQRDQYVRVWVSIPFSFKLTN